MPEQLLLDRLQQNLSRLRLSRVQAVLEETVKIAQEQSHSPLQVLDALLEEEVACKEQRRLDTSLKISGLPFVKTVDEFDFAFQPHLDRRAVQSLFDLSFLSRHENVLFLGPPGVGKTQPGEYSYLDNVFSRSERSYHRPASPPLRADTPTRRDYQPLLSRTVLRHRHARRCRA